MITSRPNYPKIRLERFIRKLPSLTKDSDKYAVGEELLGLIFSYVRKVEGLHLRWNKQEATNLLHLTLNELATKKNKDPLLQKAYDQLVDVTSTINVDTKNLILEMADRIINETKSKNKAISRKSRVRKEHIFKRFVRDAIEDHPLKNHNDIRDCAIKAARQKQIIYEVDEECQKIIFDELTGARDISFPTIRDWITEIKSKS